METRLKTVNKNIAKLRKSLGLSQTEFAKELRLDEKSGRSTVNNWETGNIQVKSDDLINISKTFDVSTDDLLDTKHNPSDTESILHAAEFTGLSYEAIKMLHLLHTRGDPEEQLTIAFINRVLGNPEKAPGRPLKETTLFSWLERYVTSDSARAYYPQWSESERSVKKKYLKEIGYETENGDEYLEPEALYGELLKSRVNTVIDNYKSAEQEKMLKKAGDKK